MKRLLMSMVFILSLLLISCGQSNEDPVELPESDYVEHDDEIYVECDDDFEIMVSEAFDYLMFSSLEEFLYSYRMVNAGNATGELAELAESVAFLALETLYVPVGIPEDFFLYRLTVNEGAVNFWFLHEEAKGVDEFEKWEVIARRGDFVFGITRWGIDYPMNGILEQFNATVEDLIDGKYLFREPNSFIWASDREVMHLYTPLTRDFGREATEDENIIGFSADITENSDMVAFCEILVIDLLDDNMVSVILEELESSYSEEDWLKQQRSDTGRE